MSDKEKILIADDSAMNRAILTEMLGDGYEILEAENGRQAVAILQSATDIDLLLLDIMMPEMDGFEVLAMMNKYHWIDEVPVIMISAENASSYVERAYDLGATDYISRPFDMAVVRRRVINTLMLYAKQKRLVRLVAEQVYEKEKSNSTMINILSHIVEFRNGESGMHVLHIQTATDILLHTLVQKTDKYHLTAADISLISTASALHDIGKINIPESILNKPGRLTKEEFEVMKTHTTIGSEILEKLPFQQESDLVKTAYAICRWHHERWDGRGYPDGLKGEQIPIAAQVVSMADVYDALTSERCYKKAFDHDTAVKMILNGECGQFNPLLLECLTECGATAIEFKFGQSAKGIQAMGIVEGLDKALKMKKNGNLILPISYTDCIVVPQVATFELQDKVYVYKIVDGKASSVMIDVEKINNGREYIVKSGLVPGDVIVAEGVGLLREGTPIVAKTQGAAPQAAPAAAAQTETEKEE